MEHYHALKNNTKQFSLENLKKLKQGNLQDSADLLNMLEIERQNEKAIIKEKSKITEKVDINCSSFHQYYILHNNKLWRQHKHNLHSCISTISKNKDGEIKENKLEVIKEVTPPKKLNYRKIIVDEIRESLKKIEKKIRTQQKINVIQKELEKIDIRHMEGKLKDNNINRLGSDKLFLSPPKKSILNRKKSKSKKKSKASGFSSNNFSNISSENQSMMSRFINLRKNTNTSAGSLIHVVNQNDYEEKKRKSEEEKSNKNEIKINDNDKAHENNDNEANSNFNIFKSLVKTNKSSIVGNCDNNRKSSSKKSLKNITSLNKSSMKSNRNTLFVISDDLKEATSNSNITQSNSHSNDDLTESFISEQNSQQKVELSDSEIEIINNFVMKEELSKDKEMKYLHSKLSNDLLDDKDDGMLIKNNDEQNDNKKKSKKEKEKENKLLFGRRHMMFSKKKNLKFDEITKNKLKYINFTSDRLNRIMKVIYPDLMSKKQQKINREIAVLRKNNKVKEFHRQNSIVTNISQSSIKSNGKNSKTGNIGNAASKYDTKNNFFDNKKNYLEGNDDGINSLREVSNGFVGYRLTKSKFSFYKTSRVGFTKSNLNKLNSNNDIDKNVSNMLNDTNKKRSDDNTLNNTLNKAGFIKLNPITKLKSLDLNNIISNNQKHSSINAKNINTASIKLKNTSSTSNFKINFPLSGRETNFNSITNTKSSFNFGKSFSINFNSNNAKNSVNNLVSINNNITNKSNKPLYNINNINNSNYNNNDQPYLGFNKLNHNMLNLKELERTSSVPTFIRKLNQVEGFVNKAKQYEEKIYNEKYLNNPSVLRQVRIKLIS